MGVQAILAAREIYVRYGSLRPFEEDLRMHLEFGVVVSLPDAFVMCRPIRHDAPDRLLADIAYQFTDPDCWHIWSAAGDLTRLVELMPYRLPLLSFHRQGERRRGLGRLRVYDAGRLIALANRTGIREPRFEAYPTL